MAMILLLINKKANVVCAADLLVGRVVVVVT